MQEIADRRIVQSYWDNRYMLAEGVEHHSQQNETISKSTMAVFLRVEEFSDALKKAKRIIEVGCGTGELSALLMSKYPDAFVLATDFSGRAVDVAKGLHPELLVMQLDALRDDMRETVEVAGGEFDLLVCSNVLEHFRDPRVVIRRLFLVAKRLMLIVPWQQPVTDGYDAEGGAGHAHMFTNESFAGLRVIATRVFTTPGWVHSSAGETPKQMAVLLGRGPAR